MDNEEFELNKYKTMDQLIIHGKLLYSSSHNLSFKEHNEGLIIPYESLIARFYYAIEPLLIDITLSDKEFDRYCMKPKLFCEEVYGTPEIWNELLNINNMESIVYFKKKEFKSFPYNILDILEELLLLNEKDLKSNKSRIEKYL